MMKKNKIIMWGFGEIGLLLSQKLKTSENEIIAYTKSSFSGKEDKKINGIPLIALDDAVKLDFDYIIVAFSDYMYALDRLKSFDIPEEKIIGFSNVLGLKYKDSYFHRKCNDLIHQITHSDKIPELFDLQTKDFYLCNMHIPEMASIIEHDFVREQGLALLANEIKRKGVLGSLAEVGVYKGNFSKKMNFLFPDRRLYLFDTFEGFMECDVSKDCNESPFVQAMSFNDTNSDYVLSQMSFPDSCVIKKGLFPDTYDLIDEEFCLVSLDADLYSPIKSGLEIFYPLLSKGGYILVHDYNSGAFSGVNKAVQEYCDKKNISYVPIADMCGTIIITK